MPKRGRSNDANPLSSARKDAGSKTGANTNKAHQTALSLWHRKSGAGYHLFISYYGSQPMGVVANDADTSCNERFGSSIDGKVGGASKLNNNNNNSRGMSRAAKRRRQKKTSNPGEYDSQQQASNQHGDVIEFPPRQQMVATSHPLLLAYKSTDNHHPHLTRFIHALSRPLPLTLRFREHEQSTSSELKQLLSTNHSEHIVPVTYDPTTNIYQSAPNSSLCKSNLTKVSPKLKELIVAGSMDSTLARQELGSMLPVLCLRSVGAIKGGSKVLDLCASPGSKTLQALEIVSVKCNGKRGRVIANDVHSGRLDSLREAVVRSGLPESLTSRVTYTNYDASIFPAPKSGKLFDAIICDVPCGGDGTIRKDKHILPIWSPNISNAIHGLQLKILSRALELVKVGGVVCYSTCSLNPIEDEAVVSAALGRENDDATFELLDWPQDMLPGFIGRPGVTNWKVAFYDQDSVEKDEDDFGSLSFFDRYESALSAGSEDAKSTFWPNPKENKRMRIDRCTRLCPQDQDTGGFFVALIKRMS
ncbi:hypothetical protein ACHAXR_006523 [Thalassiosira sp. AJA248-18]